MANADIYREEATAAAAYGARADIVADRLDLQGLWLMFRRRLRVFFYTAIIIFDIMALLTVWLPPRYTASDRIQNFATEKSRDLLQKLAGSGVESNPALREFLAPLSVEPAHIDQTDGLRITLTNDEIIHLRQGRIRCSTTPRRHRTSSRAARRAKSRP